MKKKSFNNDDGSRQRPGSDYQVKACVLTDTGCYREHNEDRIVYVKPAEESQLRHKGVLAIVADGMGGHQAGEVASQMAIDVIRRSYYQGRDDPLVALEKAFIEANQAIYRASSQELTLQGMGTTATALVLRNGQVYFAHVGDSRLYQLHQGQLLLLTEDHTLVMEMLKSGLLSAEEARFHPNKNIVTRALGTHSKVDVATSQDLPPVQVGDRFILCSDGLYDLVNGDEIKEIVLSGVVHAACEQLVALAKERGGYDNISVAILAIDPMEKVSEKVSDTRG